MRRPTLVLAAMVLLLGGLGQAEAGFVNGSFETGDFIGAGTARCGPRPCC